MTGTDVVYDLYDDVMEEVVDRTSGQVQGIMGTMMRTFGELNQISDTVDRIMGRKKLNEEEMKDVEERIGKLQAELKKDAAEDEMIDDEVEFMIQNMLTKLREMMVGWTYEDKMFFSNMAEIEEEFYKFNDAIAEGSGDLKQQIGKLFETLRKIDLNKIGAVEDEDEDEEERIPRKF